MFEYILSDSLIALSYAFFYGMGFGAFVGLIRFLFFTFVERQSA